MYVTQTPYTPFPPHFVDLLILNILNPFYISWKVVITSIMLHIYLFIVIIFWGLDSGCSPWATCLSIMSVWQYKALDLSFDAIANIACLDVLPQCPDPLLFF